jgi:glucosamine-6-phosphate deaminase
MEVIVRPTTQDAVELTAKVIADAIKAKPDMTLGLATGRTMEALYAKLAEMHKNDDLDFSKTKSFNLDEYAGMAPEDVNSYRYYMNKHLFNNINIDIANTHLPVGNAPDLEVECQKYEDDIVACGGIDLQLLGIGRSGHIGFNEPLSPFRSRTRAVGLTPTTYEQNSPLFDNPEDMPKRALTMGVETVLDSSRIVMLVTGEEKADIIAKAIEGPMTSMISASAIQLHPNCTVIIDEAAATKLTMRDFYDFLFANEPQWTPYR